MAELKVLKTDASMKSVITQYEEKKSSDECPMTELVITSLDSCKTETLHDCGDILLNTEADCKFALVVKEDIGGKMITSAMRMAVFSLLNHLVENGGNVAELIISRHDFMSSKEVIVFTCTLKEFLETHFKDIINDTVTLVIADCRHDD